MQKCKGKPVDITIAAGNLAQHKGSNADCKWHVIWPLADVEPRHSGT